MSAARRPSWLLSTLDGYQPRWIVRDVLAGLSAGAVVVPQAMAYATIADLPVQVGLYTCIVPMLVYALLGGIGLPGFAQGESGFGGPAFGYILGFVVAAFADPGEDPAGPCFHDPAGLEHGLCQLHRADHARRVPGARWRGRPRPEGWHHRPALEHLQHRQRRRIQL